ncbi:hypothetical protein HKCCE2091_03010 [Rhodobacterales bacterium HKCCE2091]|nr:hypothetical protein [Rhodobacterales bacterium HKCCE2091]
MDLESFLQSLQQGGLSQFIQLSAWAFPVIESIHVVSITLVFGVIAIVDLRLLGVASVSRRVSEVARDCLPLTWVFFALAVFTGLLMFVTNAPVYFDNTWFRWKMLFIALAGVNMLIFELITARSMPVWDDGSVSVPGPGKLAGLLSIGFWIAVILCGRMIGFTLYALPF